MKYAIAFAIGALLMQGALAIVFPAPRLAGYGCEGAGGPIYAYEESDFPACLKIEIRN
jgi:hypothetical protein